MWCPLTVRGVSGGVFDGQNELLSELSRSANRLKPQLYAAQPKKEKEEWREKIKEELRGARIPGVSPPLAPPVLLFLCTRPVLTRFISPPPPSFQQPPLSLFFLLIFLPAEIQNPCNPRDRGPAGGEGKRHERASQRNGEMKEKSESDVTTQHKWRKRGRIILLVSMINDILWHQTNFITACRFKQNL